MLGQINEWFFHDLAGIQSDPAAPGFQCIIIRPAIVGNLTFVNASYDSIHGKITSSWKCDGKKITLNVKIPCNTSATVFIPTSAPGTVAESGRAAGSARGVKFLRVEAGAAVYQIDSGDYLFTAEIRQLPN
jgi:hypothetical protein